MRSVLRKQSNEVLLFIVLDIEHHVFETVRKPRSHGERLHLVPYTQSSGILCQLEATVERNMGDIHMCDSQ